MNFGKIGLLLLSVFCAGVDNLSFPPRQSGGIGGLRAVHREEEYIDELDPGPGFDEDFPGSHTVSRRSPRNYDFRSVNNEKQLIPDNYNILDRPNPPDGSTTKVNFSVILFSVRGIDEKEEKLTIEMNLRMYWEDLRLNHLANETGNSSFLVVNTNLLQSIWHPDVYIDHAMSISQPAIMDAPASLRIYPNSAIRYSARLTVTMACRMDFHFYPVDTQKCHIQLKSYAYNKDLTEFSWLPGKRGAFVANKLDLPNFDVALEQTNNFTTITSSGVYSNLELVISLKRKLSYHLIQTYLPSSIFLVVSWLSFLIPKESVPERIGSCMMTLLTLTVMFGAVGQSMPKVSYLTALDIWMVTCIVFVFVALIEFTVVLKLWSMESAAKNESEEETFRNKNDKNAKRAKSKRKNNLAGGSGGGGGGGGGADSFEMKEQNSYKKYNKVFNNCNTNPAFTPEGHSEGQGADRASALTMTEHEYETVRDGRGEEEEEEEEEAAAEEESREGRDPALPHPRKIPSKTRKCERAEKYVRIAKGLEKVTSITLPCLFLIFNWIYWPWLTFSSEGANRKD